MSPIVSKLTKISNRNVFSKIAVVFLYFNFLLFLDGAFCFFIIIIIIIINNNNNIINNIVINDNNNNVIIVINNVIIIM